MHNTHTHKEKAAGLVQWGKRTALCFEVALPIQNSGSYSTKGLFYNSFL